MVQEKEMPAPATVAVRRSRIGLYALGLFPLLILAAIVYVFLTQGTSLVGTPPAPLDALTELDFERVVLQPNQIVVQIRNTGPVEAIVGQVTVNGALWDFAISPSDTVPRLRSALLSLTYPWVETEPLEIQIITSNGMTFSRAIDIPVVTPTLGWRTAGNFALLGVYAGVIPVFLGLLWLPFLRRLKGQWLNFLISLTVGILIFLGVDVLVEGFEAAVKVPGIFRGVGVLSIGLIIGTLGLLALGKGCRSWGHNRSVDFNRLILAYMISVGIGLHNFGEGLAIGAAFILGEIALGALLVVGFTIHNATEGFGILGPVSRQRVPFFHLVNFGLIAGGPTVLGTLIGGFTYYDVLAAFFFALGAGAIFYVVYELSNLIVKDDAPVRVHAINLGGLLAGLLLMYATGLLVVTA